MIFAVLKRRLLQWRETEDSFCFYSYTVRSLLSQYIMPVNYNDCEASLLTYWEKATELCRWHWRSRPRPTAIVPPITLKISNEIALGIRPYGWLYTQTPNCYSLRGSDTTPLYQGKLRRTVNCSSTPTFFLIEYRVAPAREETVYRILDFMKPPSPIRGNFVMQEWIEPTLSRQISSWLAHCVAPEERETGNLTAFSNLTFCNGST